MGGFREEVVNMEIKTIASLAQMVGSSKRIVEIELSSGGTSLKIKRETAAAVVPDWVPAVPAPSPTAAVASASGVLAVRAGSVGIFRARKLPLDEGTAVSRGDVLGSIETMRIPSDVLASVTGTVTTVRIADGAAVEYGQVLFELQEV